MISGRANSARSAGGETSPYRSAAGPPNGRMNRISVVATMPIGGLCHLKQRRDARSEVAHQAAADTVGAGRGCDPADDARRDDSIRHRRGTRQRVRTAAGETDDGHLVDAQRVGDRAQVVGELEDVLVLVRRRRPDPRPVDADQTDVRLLRHRPLPRWGSASARPGCRAARRWFDPAARRTRRTRSGGPRRRRRFLRASGDRLRQPCPECRMSAVSRLSGVGTSWRIMASWPVTSWTNSTQSSPRSSRRCAPKLAAAAKKRGDAAAAKRISAARKPTTAAWVVNLLVHANEDVKHSLTDLGERLRAAHAAMDGAAIRELSAEQRSLVDELARAAFEGAEVPNPSATLREDVTATLQAAVADPDVAERLGRLAKAEQWSGFGDFGDTTAVSHRCAQRQGQTEAHADEPAARSRPARDADDAPPRASWRRQRRRWPPPRSAKDDADNECRIDKRIWRSLGCVVTRCGSASRRPSAPSAPPRRPTARPSRPAVTPPTRSRKPRPA